MPVVTWTTLEGRVIPVKDMEIDHMHRCVHHVARMRKLSMLMLKDAVETLRYAADAPDGASMAADAEANELLDAAYDFSAIELRVQYAIKYSKPIAAMVRRLKNAKVDYLKTPPKYVPKVK